MPLRLQPHLSDSHLKKYLFHISIGLLGIAAFAVLGLRIYFIYIDSPNLGAMETSVVYGLQRVLADLPLFSNPEQPPFAIIQYSPLYYSLLGAVGKWLSVNPDEPFQVYVLSRWAGLIFNLIGLAMLGYVLKGIRLENKVKIALLFIAWLCLEPGHYARPDSLQSLWFLVFVVYGFQYVKKRSLTSLVALTLAASLACWTKQNGVLLPLFILFYLVFIQKNVKYSIWASALLLGFNALLWLMLVDDPDIFLANIVKGVDNGISPVYFLSTIYDSAVKKFSPFFLIGLYLAWTWAFYPVSPEKKWLGWLLGSSFVFASVTALKWGSIPAYYADFVNLSLIGAAYWGADFQQGKEKLFSGPQAIFASITLLLVLALHTSGKEWGRVLEEGNSEWVEHTIALRSYVNQEGLQADEYIFTHDYLINLYFFRQCLFPQNDIVYCCAEPRATYDYSAFSQLIETGKIRYVIDWKGDNPRSFLGEGFDDFQQLSSIGPYMIWENKSPD